MKHKGAFAGGLIGMVVAVLMLLLGFWKTILVILFIGIGVVAGMSMDGNNVIKDYIEKLKNK
ncbi:MAG: DUF2273 domain-containing protein [Clostridia bacterium]|nr:DUF2273 domain-containing protein [Clostridia bacterium]